MYYEDINIFKGLIYFLGTYLVLTIWPSVNNPFWPRLAPFLTTLLSLHIIHIPFYPYWPSCKRWYVLTYLFCRQYNAKNFNENEVKEGYVFYLTLFFSNRMMLHVVFPQNDFWRTDGHIHSTVTTFLSSILGGFSNLLAVLTQFVHFWT